MILQALVQYYEALLARGEIDRPGWSKVNVSWRLDLNPDGSLFDVSPLQKPSPNGKKMPPQRLAVPAQVKRQIFCVIRLPTCSAWTTRVSPSAPKLALKPAAKSIWKF